MTTLHMAYLVTAIQVAGPHTIKIASNMQLESTPLVDIETGSHVYKMGPEAEAVGNMSRCWKWSWMKPILSLMTGVPGETVYTCPVEAARKNPDTIPTAG